MSKYWLATDAVCPYYRDENAVMVRCDGWVPEAVTHLAFATRSEAKNYKQVFCRKDYEHCAIYHALTIAKKTEED